MHRFVAFTLLLLASSLWAGNWLGLKAAVKANPASSNPNQARKGTLVSVDTTFLNRKVTFIPTATSGDYLGTLAGVRCFNCSPNVVLLNIEDSLSSQESTLSLRVEVWNNIERPLKERRIFDHDNRCFYFAHKEVDTVFIGGEWNELRIQDVPCYPYLQRTANLIGKFLPTLHPKELAPESNSDLKNGPRTDSITTAPVVLDQNE
jgi:hypothetical protein